MLVKGHTRTRRTTPTLPASPGPAKKQPYRPAPTSIYVAAGHWNVNHLRHVALSLELASRHGMPWPTALFAAGLSAQDRQVKCRPSHPEPNCPLGSGPEHQTGTDDAGSER